jgi:predicted amidohydrolase
MLVTRDIGQNELKIMNALATAGRDRADFLVTPEGSLSGYQPDFNQEELDSSLERITQTARDLGVGLFLGTCFKERENGREKCYNQVRVYTPQGAYLGYYAKILRCSPPEDPEGGEVRDYAQGHLKLFEAKGVKIGVLICNDLWATPGYTCLPNPYLPLQLKKMGAQIIVHSINSATDPRFRSFHNASVEAWAMTLKLPIVGVNAAGANDAAVNAPTSVVGPDGVRLITAPETGEQYFSYLVHPA